ncbi:MAG TPA: Gfo/Idh/MocA family oxidoreductase [Spirochaetia bacterium]|nr:Gfo/Idh/MocA family oxidoreductase [Spirochaetia bacterium]
MKNSRKWRIAGINFDHDHMGDNLRMAFNHPDAEIVGVCHEEPRKMDRAIQNFSIPADRVFTDYRQCLERSKPDLVILCPATARHAEWVLKVAPYGVHVLLEKPFASCLADADAMIAALRQTGKLFAINWPLAWYPPHVTAKRLIDEGAIGDVIEVHFYDGNRGPLYHTADKVELTEEEREREKPFTWFYKKEAGGGSLLDYLGYGVTLGTWYHGGKAPIEVTSVVDEPAHLEVDEHSITVARYASGLSRFETRWGTQSDPWTHQPQPKCGFVIVGRKGSISTYDFEKTVRLQTPADPAGSEIPVDTLQPPRQNPVQYVIHCLENGEQIEGPLSPGICRTGQRIVDSAVASALHKHTVRLV